MGHSTNPSLEHRASLVSPSPFQRGLVDIFSGGEVSPNYVDLMLLRWAHLIKPRADVRRLSRAFDQLVQRHDTLRLRLVEPRPGTWMAEILPKHPTGLVVEDLGELSDAEFETAVEARAAAPLSIFADPLFQVSLLRCGSRGDVVLIRANHSLIDGYSAVTITEELFRLAVGLPPLAKPVSHQDAQRFIALQKRARAAEKAAYWREIALPVAPEPVLGRKKKGLPGVPHYQIKRTAGYFDVWRPDQLAAIEARAAAMGSSPGNYLMALFCETLCRVGQVETVLLGIIRGRTEPELRGYAGEHNVYYPVRHSRPGHWNLDTQAARVADQIRRATEYMPTAAFDEGGEIATAYADQGTSPFKTFFQIPNALGRLNAVQIAKGQGLAAYEEMRLGPISVQRLPLKQRAVGAAELKLSYDPTKAQTPLSIDHDTEAFEPADLTELAETMRTLVDTSEIG